MCLSLRVLQGDETKRQSTQALSCLISPLEHELLGTTDVSYAHCLKPCTGASLDIGGADGKAKDGS